MKQIAPYRTLQGALNALDNGGRFYNVFTKAKDEVITDSELFKAAGVFSGKAQAFLFFELALSDLSEADRDHVIQRLSGELRSAYLRQRPKRTEIEVFEQVVRETDAVIVAGFPVFLEDKTQFSGFIFIPICTGKVTTFMMVPIFDKFDVYEVYANSDLTGDKTIIATVRGSKRLSPALTTFGGIVKKLKFKNESERTHSFYVETLFYKTA
ncbi:MAG: hypothetical protein JSU70_10105 [Phycisphaerales bacterium]|nr:MAG: hypothetical protein JSU70_10105 [Phycisphaerales bacterium]